MDLQNIVNSLNGDMNGMSVILAQAWFMYILMDIWEQDFDVLEINGEIDKFEHFLPPCGWSSSLPCCLYKNLQCLVGIYCVVVSYTTANDFSVWCRDKFARNSYHSSSHICQKSVHNLSDSNHTPGIATENNKHNSAKCHTVAKTF